MSKFPRNRKKTFLCACNVRSMCVEPKCFFKIDTVLGFARIIGGWDRLCLMALYSLDISCVRVSMHL